ncbi:hypothetical protein I4U23_001317 [Adineta vaga]|nr:hypothetical protein I4U23_001317 [Adineta vaga]
MTKDRLREFKDKVRECDDGESISLFHYFTILNMEEPFMSEFFERLNMVRENIQKISELVDQVALLQNMLLASNMTPGIKEQLEDIMVRIKQLGNAIRIQLKQMKHEQEMESVRRRKNVRQRIIDAQIDACTKYFCATMNRYYESVVAYQERCKVRIVRQLGIANIKRTDEEVEEILQKGHSTLFPEIIIELQDARQQFNDMKSRHNDITRLEDDIKQIRDVFLDLAYMVYNQDEQIHTIEDELSSVEIDIEQISKLTYSKKDSSVISIKFSRKKYFSPMFALLARVFSTCLYSRRLSCV